MLDIVPRLRRIVEKARDGMPRVGIETLLEAANEIERLRKVEERFDQIMSDAEDRRWD